MQYLFFLINIIYKSVIFFLEDSMSTSSYLIIGAVAGFVATTVTANLIILCSKKQKQAISNEVRKNGNP